MATQPTVQAVQDPRRVALGAAIGNPIAGAIPDFNVFQPEVSFEPGANNGNVPTVLPPSPTQRAMDANQAMQDRLARHVMNPRLTAGGQMEDQTAPKYLDLPRGGFNTNRLPNSWDENRTQINPDWQAAFEMKHPEYFRDTEGNYRVDPDYLSGSKASIDPNYGSGFVTHLKPGEDPVAPTFEGKSKADWFGVHGPAAGNARLQESLARLSPKELALYAQDKGYKMPRELERYETAATAYGGGPVPTPVSDKLAGVQDVFKAPPPGESAQYFEYGPNRLAEGLGRMTGLPLSDMVRGNEQTVARVMENYLPRGLGQTPLTRDQQEMHDAIQRAVTDERHQGVRDFVKAHEPAPEPWWKQAFDIAKEVPDAFADTPTGELFSKVDQNLKSADRYLEDKASDIWNKGEKSGKGFIKEGTERLIDKLNRDVVPKVIKGVEGVFGKSWGGYVPDWQGTFGSGESGIPTSSKKKGREVGKRPTQGMFDRPVGSRS